MAAPISIPVSSLMTTIYPFTGFMTGGGIYLLSIPVNFLGRIVYHLANGSNSGSRSLSKISDESEGGFCGAISQIGAGTFGAIGLIGTIAGIALILVGAAMSGVGVGMVVHCCLMLFKSATVAKIAAISAGTLAAGARMYSELSPS